MNREELRFALRAALTGGDAALVRKLAADSHPADLAAELGSLPAGEVRTALLAVDGPTRADLFGYLPTEQQLLLSRVFSRGELATLFHDMSSDERADLFKLLSDEVRDSLLPALAQAEREDLRRLSAYPEGTVGSVMSSDYATIPIELNAGQALEHLRRIAPDAETIYQAYVIDERRRLLGVVSLRELVLAHPTTPVESLMRRDPIHIQAGDPREQAARLIGTYDLLALPVINGGDALVGIVTVDDAMDVAEEEATEDFHKAGGSSALRGVNMLTASPWLLYRKRVFWLVVLVFGNLFSGAGIAYFEDTIAAYIALVFFLPLLVDSGGNAGSQAATLMVRALATGNVRLRDWGSMLGREVIVAALLGVTMALAVSGLGWWRGGPEIAVVVASSMVLIVLVGSTIGMSMPFLLSRFKLDPATASAPLITSIADAAGVLIYFSIAFTFLTMPEAAADVAEIAAQTLP